MYYGGGIAMMNDFLSKYGVHALPCGNTGMQWGGWFRKEIKSAADMQGLKMRIAASPAAWLPRWASSTQQIAPGDIYPALERGAIDAVEYIWPYDDEKLGFNRVAKHYYTPGGRRAGPSSTRCSISRSGLRCRTLTSACSKSRRKRRPHRCSPLRCQEPGGPDAARRFGRHCIGVSPRCDPDHVCGRRGSLQIDHRQQSAFAKIYAAQKEFRDRTFTYHQAADLQYDLMMAQIRSRKT